MIGGSERDDSHISFPVAILNCSTPDDNSADLNCVHHCSGSLISRRAILTAGHCFVEPRVSTDRLYALVGAEDYLRRGDQSELIKISRTVNRGYGTNSRFPLDNDVGLAFLEHEVANENNQAATADSRLEILTI